MNRTKKIHLPKYLPDAKLTDLIQIEFMPDDEFKKYTGKMFIEYDPYGIYKKGETLDIWHVTEQPLLESLILNSPSQNPTTYISPKIFDLLNESIIESEDLYLLSLHLSTDTGYTLIAKEVGDHTRPYIRIYTLKHAPGKERMLSEIILHALIEEKQAIGKLESAYLEKLINSSGRRREG